MWLAENQTALKDFGHQHTYLQHHHPAEEAAPEVVSEVEAPKEETPEAPAAETTEEKA